MRIPYTAPYYQGDAFNCAHCGVMAPQQWSAVHAVFTQYRVNLEDWETSRCAHCKELCIWYQQRMMVPDTASIEPRHEDLPEDCIPEYEEARTIYNRSPRSSAALLRLCLQKLMPHLGESGKNINADIASLVAKGLPDLVQHALDFCRVVGNDAVHPGEIDLNDTPEIAAQLFSMINFVVEERITRPAAIRARYAALPEQKREAIRARDQKKLTAGPNASETS